MEEENNTSLIALIKHLFSSSFKLVTDTLNLVLLETRLAGKSLKKLLLLLMVQIALLITAWLGINGMLICFLIALSLSPLAALSIDTFINILFIALIGWRMLLLKEDLGFHATRRQLFGDKQNEKLDDNGRVP